MKHLTVEQRYTISVMIQQGYKQKEIAKAIEKDKSVISREIKRNCDKRIGEYRHDLAQRKCEQRHHSKSKKLRFTEQIKTYVDTLLKQYYSPEQIYGRAKLDNIDCVSPERIYQYVWQDKKANGDLYTHLRRKGRKYRKRGAAKDSRGIIKERVDILNVLLLLIKRLVLAISKLIRLLGKTIRVRYSLLTTG